MPEPSQSGMSTDEFFGSAILVVAFLGFLIVPPALLPSSIHALWVAVLLTAFILIGVGYWIWLFRRSRRTA